MCEDVLSAAGPDMLTDEEFCDMIQRAKSGDQDAATEIVRLYEPEIRRAARLRLTDPQMRRMVDSMDIAQSVFGRFFHHAEEGQLQLDRPEQLLALLTKMTRNRIIDEHRRQTALKRGGAADVSAMDPMEIAAETPGPKTTAQSQDLLKKIRARLSADELQLADRRNSGESWDEIAAGTNDSPDTLRKRLERALKRVREEIEEA